MQKVAKRENWSGHFIFILACIGSAVGLGNIWRFPYMTGLYGGGTFVLLYLLAILLIGLPVLLVELSVGKKLRVSAIEAFRKMLSGKWWVALFPLGLCLLVLSYYLVVMGWTLFYAAFSLFGSFPPFSEAVGSWFLPMGGVASLLLVVLVSRVNIKDGLEKVNLYLFPVFFGCLLLILLNALTLPGFGEAVTFLTTIDTSLIFSPIVIISAIAQAIFSLSVGEAIMLTYGSYLKKKDEIFHSSLAIAGADTFIAIMGALVVFTVTFTFALPTTSGAQLAFETLPYAFLSMPYGMVVMALFFILLFSAATTSAVSISEVLVDNLKTKTGSRNSASIAMLALLMVFFIPSLLSFSPVSLEFNGTTFLEFLDVQVVGRFAPLVVAISLIAFTWGWKDCRKTIEENLPALLATPVYLMAKYVVPVAVLVLQAAEFLGI